MPYGEIPLIASLSPQLPSLRKVRAKIQRKLAWAFDLSPRTQDNSVRGKGQPSSLTSTQAVFKSSAWGPLFSFHSLQRQPRSTIGLARRALATIGVRERPNLHSGSRADRTRATMERFSRGRLVFAARLPRTHSRRAPPFPVFLAQTRTQAAARSE